MFDAATLRRAHEVFMTHYDTMNSLFGWYFRYLDPEKREDAIQNSLELSWMYFARAIQKGEWDTLRPIMWAAMRHTRAGRSILTSGKGKSVHSDAASGADVDLDRIVGVRRGPCECPQAEDVRGVLDRLGPRHRSMAMMLAEGERTGDVAEAFGVTPGAVSQLRNRVRLFWERQDS